ncbi:hypothetical protein OXYTRIMIC_308 [Oxytricha trifallax]|uniref:Uncharacterized protein n=1 Tax=Oxytricha trifallax TaxID=1172189 RepID=A0A073I032_9SPIT|nr:hypothetical protein OXYTRIMIC_308 [Oxytricha trifallax]
MDFKLNPYAKIEIQRAIQEHLNSIILESIINLNDKILSNQRQLKEIEEAKTNFTKQYEKLISSGTLKQEFFVEAFDKNIGAYDSTKIQEIISKLEQLLYKFEDPQNQRGR